MKIGIIGPPQSGKTSVLRILLQADVSGNIGIFKAVDHRVEEISRAFSSKKTSYPELTFVDLGHVPDLNKKDLSQLQDIDLFICVIGAFFSEDPEKAFERVVTDIIITDLEVLQNRIARIGKEGKKSGSEQELKILEKYQAVLSEGMLLRKAGLDKEEINLLSGLVFLSSKPLILAINISEEDRDQGTLEKKIKPLEEYACSMDIRCIRFFGKLESEVLELEPGERERFLKEMASGGNFRGDVSRLILTELNLITFFTTGDKESRGWYLRSGLPVIEAAGKIHSDMRRGFIRAEVVNFEDFSRLGSMHKAREAGVLKVEGKDYIVKDADIINIRFNV